MTPDRAAAESMTGSHYSLVRVVATVPLAVLFAARLLHGDAGIAPLIPLIAAAGVAAGCRDRWFAVVLVPLLVAEIPGSGLAGPIGLAAFFALHATTPAAPYGSLDARGRPDPDGGWRMHPRTIRLLWRILTVIALLRAIELLGPATSGTTALALTTALGGLVAFRGRPDPLLWLLLATLLVVAMPLAPHPLGALAVATGLAATASPAWQPPDPAGTPMLLFYDGACGLCHRIVRFLLAEDRAGRVHFAPLGGPTFMQLIAPADRAGLPDSMVLRTADGTLLVGAAGAIAVGRALGGWWGVAARAAALLPTRILEAAYAGVARVRRRLFRRPTDACPLLPPTLRGRFPDLAA